MRRALGEQSEATNLADLAAALFGAHGLELEPHSPVSPREPPDR